MQYLKSQTLIQSAATVGGFLLTVGCATGTQSTSNLEGKQIPAAETAELLQVDLEAPYICPGDADTSAENVPTLGEQVTRAQEVGAQRLYFYDIAREQAIALISTDERCQDEGNGACDGDAPCLFTSEQAARKGQRPIRIEALVSAGADGDVNSRRDDRVDSGTAGGIGIQATIDLGGIFDLNKVLDRITGFRPVDETDICQPVEVAAEVAAAEAWEAIREDLDTECQDIQQDEAQQL